MDWGWWLPLIWFGIIGFAVFMYVLLDGFDLGIGILFPFAPSSRDRDVMMNTVAPIWDGNETWLVLGGSGLLAAFPLVYSVVLPALYLPLLLMLIALVFRGVAFEFRFKAHNTRGLWSWSFSLGSLLATFAQGIILGAFIRGFELDGRDYAGGPLDWLAPFPLFTGFALVGGYALLGASWLIMKTEGPLQQWCYRWVRPLTLFMIGAVLMVSVWTPMMIPEIAARWFSWPNLLYLSPVPVLTALLALWLWRAVTHGAEHTPFLLTLALFLLAFVGLAISIWPNILPPDVSIWEAASPPMSQGFLLAGVAFLIPLIVAYTAYSYYIFRGKMHADAGYHGH